MQLTVFICAVCLFTLPVVLAQTNLARDCSGGNCPTGGIAFASSAENPDATKINDGNSDGVYANGACATLVQQNGAGSATWLYVDMEEPREVGFVKLHARSDSSTQRMDQFEIRLGYSPGELDNPVCHSPNQNANTITWVNWAVCNGVGRYLFLVWYPTTDSLVDVCEVEIFAPMTINDVAPPFRWYRAKNWDAGSGTLEDIGSSGQDSVSSSGVAQAKAGGNEARQAVDYIYGDATSFLTWDTLTVPTNFTLCSVTRYTGTTQFRILNGGEKNWLHGHWGTVNQDAVGGAYYARSQGNWNSFNLGGLAARPRTDWRVQCGKNSGPDNPTSLNGAGTNFITYGRFNGDFNVGFGDVTLHINGGQFMPFLASEWALHQVVIWDTHLSEAQFVAASDILHIGLEECGCTILDAADCTGPGYSFNTTACDCSCTQCPPGTFNNGTAMDGCTACAAGTYAGGNASTACEACPAGTYLDFTGGSSCIACPAGTYSQVSTVWTSVCAPTLSTAAVSAFAVAAESRSEDVLFVCKATFPVSPSDGLLFEIGGNALGLWVGILNGRFFIQGGQAPNQGNGLGTDVGTSYASTSYFVWDGFPQDGAEHTVTIDFKLSNLGAIRVWIDGIPITGTVEQLMTAAGYAVWAGANDGAYGVTSSTDVPIGCTTIGWAGTVTSNLTMFTGEQRFGDCSACPAIDECGETVAAAPTSGSLVGSSNITDCICAANFEGSGSSCTACRSGKYKANIGDGLCLDMDECVSLGAITVTESIPGDWVNLEKVVDGNPSAFFRFSQPIAQRTDCADVAYLTLDMGAVVTLNSVTLYYFGGPYCSQSVDVSSTGAFGGEETRGYECGDYADCGGPRATQVVTFNTPGRYIRVGSSRSSSTISIYLLEVTPTYTTNNCTADALCLNTDPGFSCVTCPANTVSPTTWTNITDCICDLGFTGPDGTACTPCEEGFFKDVNGSDACQACPVGTWLNVTNGTVCVTCPAYTDSLMSSDDITDCICLAGSEGVDGIACSSCTVGKYKAVNGSGSCLDCEAGFFSNVTAGFACAPCPSNAISLLGSVDMRACVCPIGMELSNPAEIEAGCTRCRAGMFKAQNGLEPCLPCKQHTFQPSTGASSCLECATGLFSPEGAVQCIAGDGVERGCFTQDLSLEAVCAARTQVEFTVSGCSASQMEMPLDVMQVSKSRTDVGIIATTCGSFYAWICTELGVAQGDVFDCDFYCDYFASVREGLAAGCASDEDCREGAPATFHSMRPASGFFCAEQARYALYSSCVVPAPLQQRFAASVDSLLATVADSDECAPARQELQSEDSGPAPSVAGSSPECSEKTDCRFACFNHGFSIVYEGSVISLTSKYVGICDCSIRGFFNGSIVFGEAMSVEAINELGDTATMHAVPAFNQMMLNIESSDASCTFAQNFNQGSLLGLPTESPVRPSRDGVLDFTGYDEALAVMTRGTVGARRRRFTSSSLSHSRRLSQVSGAVPAEFAGACPQENGDCRHDCLSSGFASEAFGALLLLYPSYEGDCDCSQILAETSESGEPVLIGEVFQSDGSSLSFSFPDQFYTSFLPQEGNSSTSTDPISFLSAVLVPFGDGMVLNVGGECAYRIGVAAGTLNLVRQALAARQAGITKRVAATITLVQHDSSLAGPRSDFRECKGVDTCDFSCLFTGLAKVSDGGNEILGNSLDKGCGCKTYGGLSTVGNRVSGEGWLMEADFESNALFYRYWTGDTVNCSGYLNVEGGVFLGIPVPAVFTAPTTTPPPAEEDDDDELEPVSVQTAEDLAVTVTTIVGTAVGMSVAASVAGAVASSAGAAAGGAAGGAAAGSAGGGGAVSLVMQVQGLALYGRVGGAEIQPESTRAFSKGLEWANFHIIRLWGEGGDEASQRRKTSSDTGDDGSEELEYTRTCRTAQLSTRELAGTWLMAAIAVLASSIVRSAVNGFIASVFRRRGIEQEGPAIPMWSWELQVFLLQFQGIAESAGEAIASKCFGYEIAGAVTLLFLVLAGGFVMLVVVLAIRRRMIRWEGKTFKEGVINMRDAFRESKGKGLVARFRAVYAAYIVLNQRGEWAAPEKSDGSEHGNTVLDRFGSFFDGAVGGAWYFGFWGLIKVITTGIVLAAVFSPEANAGTILALNCMESVLLIVSRPQVEWMGLVTETYKAMINLATLGSIMAFVQGSLSSSWFSHAFTWLAVVSVVPSAIAGLLGPIVALINSFKTCLATCGGVITSANLGAAAGTAAAVTAVARGDDTVHDLFLQGIERKEDAGEEREGAVSQSENRSVAYVQGDMTYRIPPGHGQVHQVHDGALHNMALAHPYPHYM